jgi:hypothetical protein
MQGHISMKRKICCNSKIAILQGEATIPTQDTISITFVMKREVEH